MVYDLDCRTKNPLNSFTLTGSGYGIAFHGSGSWNFGIGFARKTVLMEDFWR